MTLPVSTSLPSHGMIRLVGFPHLLVPYQDRRLVHVVYDQFQYFALHLDETKRNDTLLQQIFFSFALVSTEKLGFF